MTYEHTGGELIEIGSADWGRPPGERGEISVAVSAFAPGSGAPLHRHPYEETILIRAGRGRFRIGSEIVEAGEGELVIVPAGVWHGFEALEDEPLRQIDLQPVDRPVVEYPHAA